MKKDLDQLIAEFKQMNGKSLHGAGCETDVTTCVEEMTWEERGKLLLGLIEEHNGVMSQKDLFNHEIEKIGLGNNEEGRLYLRNFLSWYIQQRIIIKKRIKNKVYFAISQHYRSNDLKEYFRLVTNQRKSDVSPEEKFEKRSKNCIAILERKGPLPLDMVLNNYLGEIGFPNDSLGRAEAQEFFNKLLSGKQVRELKKECISFLVLPEQASAFPEDKTESSEEQNVICDEATSVELPETEQIVSKMDDEPASTPLDSKQTLSVEAEGQIEGEPVSPRKLKTRSEKSDVIEKVWHEELDLYHWKVKFDKEIDDLESEIIRIADERKELRRKLHAIESTLKYLCIR